MLKFNGLIDNNTKKIHGTKYILSAASENTVALDGAELIPIDLGGRLVTHPTISINELGKQLLKAASEGNVDDIKNLLTKGAPFTADWLGTSPLHLSAQNNHLEITEILLRAGISKDARTKVDRTPLHMAAYEGHLQIVDTLIKHGADIDCRDLLGMTPLHWAVQNGHSEVVELLVTFGAQANLENKFSLTPLAIAQQIKRADIEECITRGLTDSTVAAQNLVIQLAADDAVEDQSESQDFSEDMELENSNHESIVIPIAPEMMTQFEPECSELEEEATRMSKEDYFQEQDQESIEIESEHLVQSVNVDATSFTDSLKLLQEHGITMLQNDENEDGNILNSMMENGHSVVLTDVGKEMLNSVKQSEQQRQLQMEKKIVQVTPEEFLAMTTGSVNSKNVLKQIKVLPNKNQVKRIVMKKNKIIPITSAMNMRMEQKSTVQTTGAKSLPTDMELVMNQLIEAKKTIEEYKIKLFKKEQEAERYKMQLKLLLDPS